MKNLKFWPSLIYSVRCMKVQPFLLYDILLYLLLGYRISYIHYGSVREAICLYFLIANRKFSATGRYQFHRVVMFVYDT